MSRRLSFWMLISLGIHVLAVAGMLALAVAAPAPMLFVDLALGFLAPDEPLRVASDGRDAGPPSSAPIRTGSKPAAPRRPARPAPSAAPERQMTPPPPAPPAGMVQPRAEPSPPLPEPVRPLPEPARPTAPSAPAMEPTPRVVAPPPAEPPPASPPGAGALDGAGNAPAAATRSGPGAELATAGRGPGWIDEPGRPHGAGGGDAATGLGVRDGSVLALAPPGDGAGEGAEYGPYYALVRSRIHELLTYPSSARRRGLSGTVEIEVTIAPTGAVAGVQLAASSSHRALDDAALDAARGLRRVPFPPGVRPRPLRMRVPIVFELR